MFRFALILLAVIATTPTKAVAGNATFVQRVCTDSACTMDCEGNVFQQGQCIPIEGTGSVIATCIASPPNPVLFQQIFATSENCTGPYINASSPLDTCFQAGPSEYAENHCGTTTSHHGTGTRLRIPQN